MLRKKNVFETLRAPGKCVDVPEACVRARPCAASQRAWRPSGEPRRFKSYTHHNYNCANNCVYPFTIIIVTITVNKLLWLHMITTIINAITTIRSTNTIITTIIIVIIVVHNYHTNAYHNYSTAFHNYNCAFVAFKSRRRRVAATLGNEAVGGTAPGRLLARPPLAHGAGPRGTYVRRIVGFYF